MQVQLRRQAGSDREGLSAARSLHVGPRTAKEEFGQQTDLRRCTFYPEEGRTMGRRDVVIPGVQADLEAKTMRSILEISGIVQWKCLELQRKVSAMQIGEPLV